MIKNSRDKINVAAILLVFSILTILTYLFLNRYNTFFFYNVCLILGISGGYLAVFVTNASEQFGTNIRVTVTTTVPNFGRGTVVPVTLLFQVMLNYTGIIYSALIVGFITIVIAYLSVRKLEETYGKDLNFLEII